MEISDSEVLTFLKEHGMLDLATVQEQIVAMKEQEYLKMHKSRVWQGTDGTWNTYVQDASGRRRLIKKRHRNDLNTFLIEFYRESAESVYIKDVFEQWLQSKLDYGEILKQTYDRYKTDFERFVMDNPISTKDIKTITENELEHYIKSTIHDKKLTAKAWGNLRTIIKGIFRLAKKKGYTDIVISTFLDEIDLSPKAFTKKVFLDDEQVFTKNEKKSVREFVAEHETVIGLGVLLAFETGLRCGELSCLKSEDIQGDFMYVTKTEIRYKDDAGHYQWEIRDSTKGRDGGRKIVLTDEAKRIIHEIRLLNPFGEFLFMKDGVRVKGQAFSRRLKTICRNLGINERSIHKARKTYATALLNAGVDEKIIQKQMGHTTINTTRNYYYFDNHEAEEVKTIIQSAVD